MLTPEPLLEAWYTALSPEPSSPFPPQVERGNGAESRQRGAGQVSKSNQQARDSPGLLQAYLSGKTYQDASVSEHRKFKLFKVCIHLEIHLKARKNPLKTQMCSIFHKFDNRPTSFLGFFCFFKSPLDPEKKNCYCKSLQVIVLLWVRHGMAVWAAKAIFCLRKQNGLGDIIKNAFKLF